MTDRIAGWVAGSPAATPSAAPERRGDAILGRIDAAEMTVLLGEPGRLTETQVEVISDRIRRALHAVEVRGLERGRGDVANTTRADRLAAMAVDRLWEAIYATQQTSDAPPLGDN